MRALSIQSFTGPDGLALVERPCPVPGPSEVRVRVVATAVNRADLLQSRGRYPAPPGVPADVPGLELAGVVVACGPGCERLRLADRVMCIVGGGSYADEAVVDERVCVRVPAELPLAVAGALPEALITAHDALVVRGGARSGSHVLIHAATSGIGTMAIRVARAVGAEVTATTRRPDAVGRLRELGAHRVVVVGADGLEAALVREGLVGSVQTVLELVGAPYMAGDLAALATEGVVVVVGTLDSARVDLDLATLMRKRARIQGTVLRARSLEEKVRATEAAFALAERVGFPALEPVIACRYTLETAADAHRRVLDGGLIGRVAIDVAPEAFVRDTATRP